MKGLFAFKGKNYVGRVVESEMGKLDGYPQKFVTVLMPDGTVETKKDTFWTYATGDEVLVVKKEQVDELHRRMHEVRDRGDRGWQEIEDCLGELGLYGLG
jgi:hypothetical protein